MEQTDKLCSREELIEHALLPLINDMIAKLKIAVQFAERAAKERNLAALASFYSDMESSTHFGRDLILGTYGTWLRAADALGVSRPSVDEDNAEGGPMVDEYNSACDAAFRSDPEAMRARHKAAESYFNTRVKSFAPPIEDDLPSAVRALLQRVVAAGGAAVVVGDGSLDEFIGSDNSTESVEQPQKPSTPDVPVGQYL